MILTGTDTLASAMMGYAGDTLVQLWPIIALVGLGVAFKKFGPGIMRLIKRI